MDFSFLNIAATSISAAKEIGKAMIETRDFNQLAAVVSNINAKLLEAQESLFAHNTQLLELQQQHFQTTQELTKAKEALAQKARYSLFEINPGVFVYRADARPPSAEGVTPKLAEPEHFICQPCFDGPDRRVVLLLPHGMKGFSNYRCPVCTTLFLASDRVRNSRAITDDDAGPNGWMGR